MEPGAQDVGRRISLRHRTDDGSARDVIGHVLAVEPLIRLERRDGTRVEIQPDRVIVWRVVPDRPVRSRRATAIHPDRLGPIMSLGWPSIVSEPLGDWELRAGGDPGSRINSVAAYGSPGMDVAEALARVRCFHVSHGLQPLVQTVTDSPTERAIRRLGWSEPSDAAGVSIFVMQLVEPFTIDSEVTFESTMSDQWIGTYRSNSSIAAAWSMSKEVERSAFLSLGAGADRAVARVVVTGEWAGVGAMVVPAHLRRRGIGARLLRSALAWATSRGADKSYLQIEEANPAARALGESFGYSLHHRCAYLAG